MTTTILRPFLRISSNAIGGFVLLLLILQATKATTTLQKTKNIDKRYSSYGDEQNLPAHKRTLTSGSGIGGSHGQPEEIFSASDQLELNYDEYPVS